MFLVCCVLFVVFSVGRGYLVYFVGVVCFPVFYCLLVCVVWCGLLFVVVCCCLLIVDCLLFVVCWWPLFAVGCLLVVVDCRC